MGVSKTIVIEGPLSVGEEDVLRFYPWLTGLLGKIRGRGWRYRFIDVHGHARVAMDLDRLVFALKYYPPRPEELEEKGTYEISAEVGEEPPAVLEILSIDSFRLEVNPPDTWASVTIDPLGKKITGISDVLWRWRLGRREIRLSEARMLYEIARFFIEKGYAPEDRWVAEAYKELVDLFEKPYRFTVTIELTVHREEKVPPWNRLVEELAEFFYRRGLLMKLQDKDREKLIARKPLP